MTTAINSIAARLSASGLSLATAESCTGGLLGSTLTAFPGASAWYRGGLVVYSNDLKIRLAGVLPGTLEREGAVSPGVARELARGAARECLADLGVGITGIAGPSGGSEEKPVGTVCLALAGAEGTRDWTVLLSGDRDEVRAAAVGFAVDRILEYLESRRPVQPDD